MQKAQSLRDHNPLPYLHNRRPTGKAHMQAWVPYLRVPYFSTNANAGTDRHFIARNFKFQGLGAAHRGQYLTLLLARGRNSAREEDHAQVLIPVIKKSSNNRDTENFPDGDTRPLDIYLIM